MKTRYFLNPDDLECQLRKLNNGKLYWFDDKCVEWLAFIYNNNLKERTFYYTEITEEEAFRHLLEN